MLIHLVSFRYRAEIDDNARHQHRAQLGTLGTIQGVLELKVGADVVRSPRSYDTAVPRTAPRGRFEASEVADVVAPLPAEHALHGAHRAHSAPR